MYSKFKQVHAKTFPSHFTYRNTLSNRVSGILLYLFLAGNLNWFEKVALLNVHLVSVARDHDPFHRSKNRIVRHTFFSKHYHTTWNTYPPYQSIHLYVTAYLLFSTFRSDKLCGWIANKYVIFGDNDCMMLGNESTRYRINIIKQYYVVVLILHSYLLSMWYVLFITKWDIRTREDLFKFYTVTIS